MAHDCNDAICTSRRELLKMGAKGLTWGLFGLALPTTLFLREAYGIVPQSPSYDAILSIFYEGGPSHIDTWDPKRNSPNYIFGGNTISLGRPDIYGTNIELSPLFPSLANLVQTDPTSFGLGIVRSMTHGNGDHGTAQEYMNNFWGTPVSPRYPSTSCVFSYFFRNLPATVNPTGIPAVTFGTSSNAYNDAKGADIPTAMEVNSQTTDAVGQTSLPVSADRYARQQRLAGIVSERSLRNRPDGILRSWAAAWQDAAAITTRGSAAAAFDLMGKPRVTFTPNPTGAPDPGLVDQFTLARELIKAGMPYVSLGITGNDSHMDNRNTVTTNWGQNTDALLAGLARELKPTGKRVLVVMGGEFGRTPDTVAPPGLRDGRDHWADSFSWAFLSVNQPRFVTTAVGSTGPDGMGTPGMGLVDPVYPGALGGFIYRAMGFPVAADPAYNIPIQDGTMAPPVDATLATSAAPGGTLWLQQKFGLA